MIYYISFFISVCFFFCYAEIRRHSYNKFNVVDGFFLLIIATPLAILSGVRDQNVGTDTDLYLKFYSEYERVSYFDFISSLSFFNEPFFKLSQYVFSELIGVQFGFFLASCSIFIIVVSISFFIRYCQNPLFAYILFLLMGFATLHFNILRQCLAIAIFFIAIQQYMEGRYSRLIPLFLIGFLIHKSFIFVIFSIFVFHLIKKLELKSIIIITVIFSVFVFFIDTIVEFSIGFDDRYLILSNTNTDSLGHLKFFLILIFFIFSFYVKINSNSNSKIIEYSVIVLFLSVLLNALTVILHLNPNGITRASVYFEPFIIIVFSEFISRLKAPIIRMIIYCLALPLFSFYFWLFVLPYGELTPFSFRSL
ncbi:EpsG family protein [Vibrio ordalii]|nr:EpsG family protein [Vibrio ordalii]MCS0350761.1 EpsG family protein [Vibrio ordalii]